MPTIAIVGAGPGLGLPVAKVFGDHGFQVALISRSKGNVDTLVATLAKSGITAAAFPADIADRAALTSALEQAAERFGAIDVLEFSPYGGLPRGCDRGQPPPRDRAASLRCRYRHPSSAARHARTRRRDVAVHHGRRRDHAALRKRPGKPCSLASRATHSITADATPRRRTSVSTNKSAR
jgi:hypothetical protein